MHKKINNKKGYTRTHTFLKHFVRGFATSRKYVCGYTIIETMIAVSLFIIIVTSGLGALLNANVLHQKSQSMRSIMDNLSFIMEDMSRNLRTGYNYHCFVTGDVIPPTTSMVVSTPKSCASGWGIAFESDTGVSSNHDDQWVYYIGPDTSLPGNPVAIWKSTLGPYSSSSFVKLTPDEVVISSSSSFAVLGAEALPGNQQQPFVSIKLVGNITFKNVVTPFSLQTSVSQRLIDIGGAVSPPSDTVWVEDSLPAGASPASDGGDSWSWVGVNPAPFSGSLAHQSNIAAGEHQHYFTGASTPLVIGASDVLVAYVYLDPANMPSQIMLQWNSTSQGWNHRAYWGANTICWSGCAESQSNHYMGVLPASGSWVRLEVPASSVGLSGLSIGGMAFTLYGGRATWDHAGKNP